MHERGKPAAVVLHVYDVTPCLNACVRFFSCCRSKWGLYHTGICLGDHELAFGGHDGDSTGVWRSAPRATRGARFRTAHVLGHARLDPIEVRERIVESATAWSGRDYHPLTRNCNHFCAALASDLGVEAPPAWTNAFASSHLLHCLLPFAERLARLLRLQPLVSSADSDEVGDDAQSEGVGSDLNSLLLEAAEAQKAGGNAAYKDERWADGLAKYRKAMRYLASIRVTDEMPSAGARHRGGQGRGKDVNSTAGIQHTVAICAPASCTAASSDCSQGEQSVAQRGAPAPAAALDCSAVVAAEAREARATALRVAVRNNAAACLLRLVPEEANGSTVREATAPVLTCEAVGGAGAEAPTATTATAEENLLAVVGLCAEVLALQPAQPKALFRRAVANRRLGGEERLEAARADLVAALQVDPRDTSVRAEMALVQRQRELLRDAEGALYRRMLGRATSETRSAGKEGQAQDRGQGQVISRV